MDNTELRATLTQELLAAGDAARTASETTEGELSQRVHKFRKALRRARATLDLVADSLPPKAARAALRTFRDARRSVSDARDFTVAPQIAGQLPFDADQQAAMNAVFLAATSETPEASLVAQSMRAGATAVVAQIEQVIALVPESIDWAIPRAGLRKIYGEARRARRDAKDDADAFHRWRRRTKELAYQLELLATVAPQAAAYAQQLEAVIDAQSLAVDLIMLIGFIKEHGDDTTGKLMSFLDQQVAGQMHLARRTGRDLFAAKPKAFVREISAIAS